MRLPVAIPGQPRVALVPIYEVIRGGRHSAGMIELLRRLREDRRVRAVILDIDSPGGEVTPSDYLYRATCKLRDEKPVIAFIRGLGASGAYLMACGAGSIVALPTAVVGSIGVLSVRPVAQQLLERIGLQFAVLKTGPYKDAGAFYRGPTAEEAAQRQALIGDFYEHFLEVVVRERRLEKEKVRALATGEIFWATRGLQLGLVDRLGDLEDALELAAERGGVAPRSFIARPARPLSRRLFGAAAGALLEELEVRVETLAAPRWP